MATDLTVAQGQLVPLSTEVRPPSADTPQVDLDTGYVSVDGQSPLEAQREAEIERQYAPQQQQSQGYAPKKFWSSHIKKIFNQLSAPEQKAWLDSFNIIEKSFAKHARDLATTFGALDDVAGVLAPHLTQIVKVLGMTPGEYVNNLIECDVMATNNPVEYILRLMATAGIQFRDLEDYVPELVDKVKVENAVKPILKNLEQKLQGHMPEIAPAVQPYFPENHEITDDDIDNAADEIREFYGQTDSSGRLLYPYAEQMYDDIVDALVGGAANSLDAAYRVALEMRRPQIPASNYRGGQAYYDDDDYSPSLVVSMNKNKEKMMLKDIAERLKGAY